jgi:hypothetical protein
MNFLFTIFIKYEVSNNVAFFRKDNPKKSAEYKGMLYSFSFILYYISHKRSSPIYFQCIYIIAHIIQVKAFTLNYPAFVPPNYISNLMVSLLPLFPLQHIKCISKSSSSSFIILSIHVCNISYTTKSNKKILVSSLRPNQFICAYNYKSKN